MAQASFAATDQLQSILRLLRRTARFWWVGVLAFAVGIAVTLAAAKVRRKQFRSEAVVFYQEGLQWTATEGVSTRRIGQRLKDILLTRTKLTKVVEELGLHPALVAAGRIGEAVEEVRLAVNFRVNDGDIFVLSYTGSTPDEAQKVTAKLTDMLIEENTRLRSEQAEVARTFLDTEKKRNEAELAAKETALLRFLAQHPEFASEQSTIGVSLRATTKRDSPSTTTAPSGGGDNALEALRREEERLRRQINSPSAIVAPQDPALVAAKNEAENRLHAAQRELTDRRSRYTEQHPDVRSAAKAVTEAEDALERATEALKAARVPIVDDGESRKALEARLAQVQAEIAAAQQRRRPRDAERTPPVEPVSSSEAAQRIVALETEWARLNREVSEARDRFAQLDTKEFMASMTASTLLSGKSAQIVVIDPAFLPAQAIGVSTKRFVIMGILAAFAIAIGVAMLFGLMDDRLYDHIDATRLAIAPVLIEITGASLAAGKARANG